MKGCMRDVEWIGVDARVCASDTTWVRRVHKNVRRCLRGMGQGGWVRGYTGQGRCSTGQGKCLRMQGSI